MVIAIIDAIRKRTDLCGSTFLAAQELTHLADDDTGIAETDYKANRKFKALFAPSPRPHPPAPPHAAASPAERGAAHLALVLDRRRRMS